MNQTVHDEDDDIVIPSDIEDDLYSPELEDQRAGSGSSAWRARSASSPTFSAETPCAGASSPRLGASPVRKRARLEHSLLAPEHSTASKGKERQIEPECTERSRVELEELQLDRDRPASTESDSEDIVHDDQFYFEDGSCILLVERTLFNVHRSILSKDSSSFSTMFTLPQGNTQAEGSSDDRPIVLNGDRASEFRNFLWALYALPHELSIVHSPRASLIVLMDISRVANKYSFKSLETWALDAIQEYVNRKPCPLISSTFDVTPAISLLSQPSTSKSTTTISATPEQLRQLSNLVRLAVLCEHRRLLTTMVTLLRQHMPYALPYAYLAMSLADDLGLRSLRGAAYLEIMQRAIIVHRGSGLPVGSVDEEGRLVVSPAQQLRLLSGYHRLTSAWERLRSTPPPFEHAPACGATWHQHGCTQSWLEFWKEKTRSDAVLSLGLADVLGRLRAVAKEFDKWGSATYMHHDCRMAARRSIQGEVRDIEDRLADYFSDGPEGD